MKLSYAPSGKAAISFEDRFLFVSAPDTSGNYYIDRKMNFTAGNEPPIFDRTPGHKLGGPFMEDMPAFLSGLPKQLRSINILTQKDGKIWLNGGIGRKSRLDGFERCN